jgi:hypothetical protein
MQGMKRLCLRQYSVPCAMSFGHGPMGLRSFAVLSFIYGFFIWAVACVELYNDHGWSIDGWMELAVGLFFLVLGGHLVLPESE